MESEGRLLKLVACSCSWFCPESGRSKQKVAELTIFSKVILLHDLLSKRGWLMVSKREKKQSSISRSTWYQAAVKLEYPTRRPLAQAIRG
jgi:hypothetical protein